jgi:hypothetical protein
LPDGAPPEIQQALRRMGRSSASASVHADIEAARACGALDSNVRAVRAEVNAKYVAVPDISAMSFEECATALRAISRLPFSGWLVHERMGYGDILYKFHQPIWVALMGRLESLDKKKARRVIESAIKSGENRPVRFSKSPATSRSRRSVA